MNTLEDTKFVKAVNRVFYEVEAPAYDARHPEVLEGNSSWWDRSFAHHAAVAPGDRRRRILDLGCGTGFVASAISRHLRQADTLFCCDQSPPMLALARNKLGRLPGRYAFVGTEADRLPFADGSMDAVTINAVLHHLPDHSTALAEADRVLRSGGLLFVAHEPNRDFFASPLIRLAASFYKLIGLGKDIDRDMARRINGRMRDAGLTDSDLSRDEILRLVEYNSPVEQGRIEVDKHKGLSPEQIAKRDLKGYEILDVKEYTTLFIRPAFANRRWLGALVKAAAGLLRGRGNLFSLVARKP